MNLEAQRRVLEEVTRFVALVGFSALVGLIALTALNVSLRYLLLPRIPGFDDYGQLLYPVIIASCFPIGLLTNKNIAITFLGMAMPAPIRRGLNLFASLLVLLFFVLVAYRFIWMTLDSEGSVTPTVLMPTTPTWWVATVLLWLTVPVQIWVCWVRLAELMTGRDLLMAKPETSAG